MYKAKKVIFYDPKGERPLMATQFFDNVRYMYIISALNVNVIPLFDSLIFFFL